MLYHRQYYSYYLIYYKPSAFYWVEPATEASIKSAQPFLRTSQSESFGAHFCDYGQYSTYTCINIEFSIILIPYAMVNHPWEYCLDTPFHFSYTILKIFTFNCKIISVAIVFSYNLLSLHTLT